MQKGLGWFFPVFYIYLSVILLFIYLCFFDLHCGDIFCYELYILLPVYALGIFFWLLLNFLFTESFSIQIVFLLVILFSSLMAGLFGALVEKYIISRRSYRMFFAVFLLLIACFFLFPNYWFMFISAPFPLWPVYVYFRLKVSEGKLIRLSFLTSAVLFILIVFLTALLPFIFS